MANFTGSLIPSPIELDSPGEPTGFEMPTPIVFGKTSEGSSGPPSVVFVEPTPPDLPSPGRSIVVEVSDADGFAALILAAEYGTGAYEVVHDGDKFAQVYAAQSTRVAIAGGFRFTMKRAGGWFGDRVTIRVFAVDAFGDTP